MFQKVIIARRLFNDEYRRYYPRITALLIILALLVGCSEVGNAGMETRPVTVDGNPVPAAPVPVRVTRVSTGSEAQRLRFAGVARPRQRANLSFQVGGSIEARFADIGQQVEQGEVVARLYNPQLQPAMEAAAARLAQLRSDAGQAERDLDRLERLYERGLLASQEVEQQRTALKSIRSAIDNAHANLSQTEQLENESELRAPFSGHIEQVLLEPGEFAQPGQAVLRMSAEGGLEVEVQVPPRFLTGLDPGDTLPVWHGLNGEEYEGIITGTGEGSSGSNALYPLVVSLRHTELRGGEALEVGVSRQRNSALTIPLNAVMRSARGLTVFRVGEDNRVQRVPVDVARITGDQVELSRGTLEAGDRIVYSGLTRLAEGDTVTVLTSTTAHSP